jgi:Protein kinase domain
MTRVRDTMLANRFRIGDRIGSGGMGEVWAALDTRIQREVAVKLVQPLPVMGELDTQIRFRREVQLAGRLSHPNIVTVHDWGETTVGGRETLFLVMELVAGSSLRQRLRESTPRWPVSAGWAAQIAQALDAAHSGGVVHRDIKPANVLLTPEGKVKVLDFGVAKFMGDTVRVNELTATGAPLGSPPYMSPEQARGDHGIDHRSDLYSLGCLLYQALTGRPPFTGGNQLAVLRMQIDDPPMAPRTLVPDLPEALDELVMRLLAKDPAERPGTAAEVRDALGGMLVDHLVARPASDGFDGAHVLGADDLIPRILARARQIQREAEIMAAAVVQRAEEAAASRMEEMRRAEEEAEKLHRDSRDYDARYSEESRRTARALLTEADKVVQRKRAEADALLRTAKARAEQITRDLEIDLAGQREKAELDHVSRRAEMDEELASMALLAQGLCRDAEARRDQAEKRARETMSGARHQADDIVAEANAETDRRRAKAEEDIAELSERRAALAKQVIIVGEALAKAIGDMGSLPEPLPPLIPRFAMQKRGYHPQQVEAQLERLRNGEEFEPAFDLVRRGYDEQQVDNYIDFLEALRRQV